MPVMAIYRYPSVSAETYDKFRAKAPLTNAPAGSLVHAYGRVGDGFVTVDIWESRESLRRYIDDVILKAVDGLGIQFEEPEVIDLETFFTSTAVGRYGVLRELETA